MIRKSALAATIAALLNPAVAGALGLGNIEVSSALNEPLQARIPLTGVSVEDVDELKAALGSDEQFIRAGLDRAFVLTSLKFKVVQETASRGYIEVSTHSPVAEPFLNFLVDVNWPNGRVLREYTVLLDPPVYGAAIRSATRARVDTVSRIPPSAPMPAPTPAPPPTYATSPAPTAAPVMSSGGTPSGFSGDSYGPVRDGETLWSIADRVRPQGTSIQNMMLALLRANPQAFSMDNVNALKTGAVLRIPAASDVRGDKAQALAEVARQHALWDEFRQSVSSSVPTQPGGTAPAPAMAPGMAKSDESGSESASSATSGSEQSELKLVGSGTTGSTTVGGAGSDADVQRLRDDLSMAQEEAEAAKQENEELRSRLGEVEGLVDDMKRLVELREDQLAALQDQLAKAGEAGAETMPATEKPETASMPTAEVEPKAEVPKAEVKVEPKPEMKAPEPAPPKPAEVKKPVVKKPPMPAPAPPPSSMLDDIQAMLPVPLWTVLAGLGALLLGFGGLRMAKSRKGSDGDSNDAAGAVAPTIDEGGSLIDQYAQTELPDNALAEDVTELPVGVSPDAATMVDDDVDAAAAEAMSATATTPPGSGTSPDDEDPLAEVNVYLAYERFDQAEQLVRDAIETYPDRTEYRLKLVEVFYSAKDTAAFESAAQQLQSVVGEDSDMMTEARAWWDDLGTGRSLFDESDGPSTSQNDAVASAADDDDGLFDVTQADTGDQTGVDFDLGFDGPGGDTAESGSDLDFDLGSDDSAKDAAAESDSSVDFDLGGLDETEAGTSTEDNPATLGIAAGAAAAGALAGAAALSSSTDVDFDLDAGDDESGDVPLPERVGDADTGLDFDLGGIDDADESDDILDFGDDDAPGTASVADDADVSDLDFDLGDTTTHRDMNAASDDGDDGLDLGLDDDGADDDSLAAGAQTMVGDDSDGELDFDLGDTGVADGAQIADAVDTGDDAELDFDLGDTGAIDSAADSESSLDFDLEDTGSASAAGDEGTDLADQTTEIAGGSELDFDLGDTGTTSAAGDEGTDLADQATEIAGGSELDFDLGDTGTTSAAGDEGIDISDQETDIAGGSELDFDLGETGAGSASIGEATETADDVSALDFDLGDTGAQSADDSSAADDDAGDFALDLDLDAGDDSEPSATSQTVFQDAMTEVSDDSSLDLMLDMGDDADSATTEVSDSGDAELPVLDMGDDEAEGGADGAFDTVQLSPDDAQSLRDSAPTAEDGGDDAGAESGFGVDTEFRGIFSPDEGAPSEEVGVSTVGTASSLDFDLGTELDDVGDATDSDDDDHTLVLGRGASGEVDEMQTKLDLAQAYMDMGDTEGARNLLGEVMADGADEQQGQARDMLAKLS